MKNEYRFKIKPDKRLKVASYNIRGLISAGRREMLEIWAKENNVDIVLLQETHINQAGMERRKHYTLFCSENEEIRNEQGETCRKDKRLRRKR